MSYGLKYIGTTRRRALSAVDTPLPQVSFICPDEFMWTVDDDGLVTNRVPIDDCLDCSIKRVGRTCPWDFADLTIRLDRDVRYASFNPSKMLGCPREHWYRINTEYPVDPATRHAMVRGTRTHAALEIPHPDILGEVTVVRYLPFSWKGKTLQLPITCRPDKVYPLQGLIHDDKTRAYLPVKDGVALPPEINAEYTFQLSVGAWCWAEPAYMVLPDGTVRVAPDPIEIYQGQVIFRDSTKQIKQQYQLFDSAWLEEEMVRRIEPYMALYDDNVIAPPLEGAETWRCRTCPFHVSNYGDCPSHIGEAIPSVPETVVRPVRVGGRGTVGRVSIVRR
jgi:hypothetical protein